MDGYAWRAGFRAGAAGWGKLLLPVSIGELRGLELDPTGVWAEYQQPL
jgi:hypothetical protein